MFPSPSLNLSTPSLDIVNTVAVDVLAVTFFTNFMVFGFFFQLFALDYFMVYQYVPNA